MRALDLVVAADVVGRDLHDLQDAARAGARHRIAVELRLLPREA